MKDKMTAYQQQMQNAYRQRNLANLAKLYNYADAYAAAAVFKDQYKPADPFDGVQIPAEMLDIPELVTVFLAAKALEDEGNAVFIPQLVEYRKEYQTPLIRVNQLWLDALKQRKYKMCDYIYKCCFGFGGSVEEVLGYEQEIAEMDDPQLSKYLRQAQEALAVEAEVKADEV